ncbi:hypothetical protein [Bacillus massiliglaciei]|uniref:hypothetical protein n=1 Tax=Bacillus massiliglaciei TaxID=1816693 RepID=UPI0018FE1585|nr:hypothetical protein [Bacillus massiliglaciei]
MNRTEASIESGCKQGSRAYCPERNEILIGNLIRFIAKSHEKSSIQESRIAALESMVCTIEDKYSELSKYAECLRRKMKKLEEEVALLSQ